MKAVDLSSKKMWSKINTMMWLVRREVWENKRSFVWVPLGLALIFALFFLFMFVREGFTNPDYFGHFYYPVGATSTSNGSFFLSGAVSLSSALTEPQKAYYSSMLGAAFLTMSLPLLGIYAVIAYFYASMALFNERMDKSILFWKSMPFSDAQSVSAKLLTVLLVAPLLVWLCATIVWFVFLFILALVYACFGHGVFITFFTSPNVYLAPLSELAMLPVFIVSALPVATWFLMVSAWAKKSPQAWSFGVPLLLIMVLVAMVSSHFFGYLDAHHPWVELSRSATETLARQSGGLVPGAWLVQASSTNSPPLSRGELNVCDLVAYSWQSLSAIRVAVALLLSTLFFMATVRLRRTQVLAG